jgi:hypothetical protein
VILCGLSSFLFSFLSVFFPSFLPSLINVRLLPIFIIILCVYSFEFFPFLHLNHYIFSFSLVSFHLHTRVNASNLPQSIATNIFWVVQGDQKISVHLMITEQKTRKKDGHHRIHSECGPCYTEHGL